jgi:hypothetical protein
MTDDPFLLDRLTPKLAAMAACALAAAFPTPSYAQSDALEGLGLRVQTNIPCAGLCPTVAAVDAQGRVVVGQLNWGEREQAPRSLLHAEADSSVAEQLEWLRPAEARRVDLICPLAPPGDAGVVLQVDRRFRFFSICSYDRAAPGAVRPDARRPQ